MTHTIRGRGLQAAAGMIIAASIPGAVHALESFPAYTPGTDVTYAAATPPVSGFFGGGGVLFAFGDRFNDAEGESLSDRTDYTLSGVVVAGAYSWKTPVMGARTLSYARIPLVSRDVEVILDTPMGDAVRAWDEFTLGDIAVGQKFGWDLENNWSVATSLELNLPTGTYENNGFISNSTNYTTAIPSVAVSYRDAANNHFSLKGMLAFPLEENEATGYKSGNYWILEGAAGVGITPRFGLDLTFFALEQFTDDDGPGVDPVTGNRSSWYAAGPGIRYHFGPNGAFVASARWMHEFESTRTVQGDRFIFQVVVPLSVSPEERARLAAQ